MKSRGRCKIEMKRIEDVTRSQVTFSKRRTGLAKKAHEVSVLCDVDIAFVAFSPSSRSVHLFSHKRFEDVLNRYINLPTDKRNYKVRNPEEKLKELERIESEEERVAVVQNQVERLQQELRRLKTTLEIEEAEASNFRPGLKIQSLSEALWREQYLEASLKTIRQKKQEMMMRSTNLIPYGQASFIQSMEMNQNGQSQPWYGLFPTGDQQEVNGGSSSMLTEKELILQMDPWLNGNLYQRVNWGEPLWLGGVVQNNHHQEAMGMNGMGLINDNDVNQNHDATNNIHDIINFPTPLAFTNNINPPDDPMVVAPPPPPMVPIDNINNNIPIVLPNHQMPSSSDAASSSSSSSSFMTLLNGDLQAQLNPQQPPGGMFDSFSNNLNWQQAGVPGAPMFNTEDQMNWFPNAPTTYGQNLNVLGIPIPPSTVPSSSLYDPSYAQMGLHVDPFIRMFMDQQVNSHSTGNNSNQAIQNQETTPLPLPPPPPAAAAAAAAGGQAEGSSLPSNNSTDTEMPEEAIEEMINSMLMTPENEEKEEINYGFEEEERIITNPENMVATLEELGIIFDD
ncbi:myocyte-specific enhancer factor 2A homolog [Macadamia integrifolia]|uniref:myocyte-specific enhancer factor 2A homolog n=1 Tax=Macadamia integrifolia TaxID=60698 RepID=UPI001C4E9353|nr:myocyte-specific enhancer factor 2A homolog [Macadamia integrifolia]